MKQKGNDKKTSKGRDREEERTKVIEMGNVIYSSERRKTKRKKTK